jgi:hypothetical protein
MVDVVWPIVSIGILVLIILIGVAAVWLILKEKRSGFALSDERSQLLNWKAAYYAMFVYQYFILAFLYLYLFGREFFGIGEIEAGYPMIATLLVSAVSFAVLRWYVNR